MISPRYWENDAVSTNLKYALNHLTIFLFRDDDDSTSDSEHSRSHSPKEEKIEFITEFGGGGNANEDKNEHSKPVESVDSRSVFFEYFYSSNKGYPTSTFAGYNTHSLAEIESDLQGLCHLLIIILYFVFWEFFAFFTPQNL